MKSKRSFISFYLSLIDKKWIQKPESTVKWSIPRQIDTAVSGSIKSQTNLGSN